MPCCLDHGDTLLEGQLVEARGVTGVPELGPGLRRDRGIVLMLDSLYFVRLIARAGENGDREGLRVAVCRLVRGREGLTGIAGLEADIGVLFRLLRRVDLGRLPGAVRVDMQLVQLAQGLSCKLQAV